MQVPEVKSFCPPGGSLRMQVPEADMGAARERLDAIKGSFRAEEVL